MPELTVLKVSLPGNGVIMLIIRNIDTFVLKIKECGSVWQVHC